ncbi:MAG TPA: Rne/Rng family ribonuclease, partial [Dissulfurispiraceae bacterium]|nr:Rne/Rng family ribonuclease [Dissulfurispiraceae bacterium]
RRRPWSRRNKHKKSVAAQGSPVEIPGNAAVEGPVQPETTEIGPAVEVQPEMAEEQQELSAQVRTPSRRRRRRSRKDKRPEAMALNTESDILLKDKQRDRTRRILINARYPEEKRVAIVEGTSLTEFYIEVAAREHLKGNIYKGVVSSVMPGLQAAFIDFGQKKHGFLQFREVMPELIRDKVENAEDKEDDESRGREGKRRLPALVKGQEILVQVEKDEHGTKGASLTTYISIPGRYIVMMPGQKRVGISRKIEGREDRDRLKEIFNSLKLPKDTGFILRTACSDSLEKELNDDLKYLTKLWDRIKADAGKATAPALIYKEQDIAMRTVRDYLTTDVVEILIDDQPVYTATKAFLRKIMPWRKVNTTHYKDKKPLFSLYNVEAQIAVLSHRQVTLPSKGYLVFDKAEALTAIDVNSGRSRKEDNIESTALTTNLEAVDEIARQLRLRDIGGLIVIDFIDMESGKNRRLVETRMREAMSDDKASTEIAGLSKFCILEMTRERFRLAYAEAISRKCPLCDGIGSLNSEDFVALAAVRELHALAAAGEITAATCRLPVESANLLINARKQELVALERDYGITVNVVADPSVPAGRYSVEVRKLKPEPKVENQSKKIKSGQVPPETEPLPD